MQAAIRVFESEGVEVVFGIPGAAILPFYKALKASRIKHYVVRHEEGGAHAAEG
jgi:tartronate-semialdehyde synthase